MAPQGQRETRNTKDYEMEPTILNCKCGENLLTFYVGTVSSIMIRCAKCGRRVSINSHGVVIHVPDVQQADYELTQADVDAIVNGELTKSNKVLALQRMLKRLTEVRHAAQNIAKQRLETCYAEIDTYYGQIIVSAKLHLDKINGADATIPARSESAAKMLPVIIETCKAKGVELDEHRFVYDAAYMKSIVTKVL